MTRKFRKIQKNSQKTAKIEKKNTANPLGG